MDELNIIKKHKSPNLYAWEHNLHFVIKPAELYKLCFQMPSHNAFKIRKRIVPSLFFEGFIHKIKH